MNILQAFSTGFRRAMSEGKLITLLYAINLLVALPLALAFQSSLSSGFGQSMSAENLLQNLDFTILADFLNKEGGGLAAILSQIVWVLLAYLIISTFLTGGILTVIREKREKLSLAQFFAGCGTYFLRFLRLFLIFGVILIVLLSVLGGVMSGVVYEMTNNALSEVTEYWARGTFFAVLLIPTVLVIMIADYAKIIVIAHDERSMLKTAWWSMKLVFRNFFRTIGLELLMVLVPLTLFALYAWLDLSIGMSSDFTIFVMFVLQQLFILSKAWTKVFFFAGEISLYHSLQTFGGLAAVPSSEMPVGRTHQG